MVAAASGDTGGDLLDGWAEALAEADIARLRALLLLPRPVEEGCLASERLPGGAAALNVIVERLGALPHLGAAAVLEVREVVELLLAHRADANAKAPPLNETPLQVALRASGGGSACLEVVSALLRGRADPNHVDDLGEGPLTEAACAGNVHACALLLDHRASPAARNVHGQRAVDLAEGQAKAFLLDVAAFYQATPTGGYDEGEPAPEPPTQGSEVRSELHAVRSPCAGDGSGLGLGPARAAARDARQGPGEAAPRGLAEVLAGRKVHWPSAGGRSTKISAAAHGASEAPPPLHARGETSAEEVICLEVERGKAEAGASRRRSSWGFDFDELEQLELEAQRRCAAAAASAPPEEPRRAPPRRHRGPDVPRGARSAPLGGAWPDIDDVLVAPPPLRKCLDDSGEARDTPPPLRKCPEDADNTPPTAPPPLVCAAPPPPASAAPPPLRKCSTSGSRAGADAAGGATVSSAGAQQPLRRDRPEEAEAAPPLLMPTRSAASSGGAHAGNAHFKARRYEEANRCYSEALHVEPGNAVLLSNRAAARMMLADWLGSYEDAAAAVRRDPSSARASERCARSLLLLGRLSQGAEFCAATVQRVGQEGMQAQAARWRPFLATSQRISKYLTAVQEVESALADSGSIIQEQADALVGKAAEMLGALAGTESSSPWGRRLRLARIRAQLLPPPGAAPPSSPPSGGQELAAACSVEARRRRVAEALEEATRLVAEEGEGANGAGAEALHWLARCQLAAGLRHGARKSLKEAIRAGSGEHGPSEELLDALRCAEGEREHGNVAFQRQDWLLAQTHYDAALQADWRRADPELCALLLCNRGAARHKAGDAAAALHDVTQALAIAPSYSKAFFRRGILHMELERYHAAADDFSAVARLTPDFVGLSIYLAYARRWARRPPPRNYYAVLGVPLAAGPAELKRAYRTLALKWHPDKNPGRSVEAEHRFREVKEAFEVLSDPRRRRLLDASGSPERARA